MDFFNKLLVRYVGKQARHEAAPVQIDEKQGQRLDQFAGMVDACAAIVHQDDVAGLHGSEPCGDYARGTQRPPNATGTGAADASGLEPRGSKGTLPLFLGEYRIKR